MEGLYTQIPISFDSVHIGCLLEESKDQSNQGVSPKEFELKARGIGAEGASHCELVKASEWLTGIGINPLLRRNDPLNRSFTPGGEGPHMSYSYDLPSR